MADDGRVVALICNATLDQPPFWCPFCESKLAHPASHRRLVCYSCGLVRTYYPNEPFDDD
jgi:hypothetical protein